MATKGLAPRTKTGTNRADLRGICGKFVLRTNEMASFALSMTSLVELGMNPIRQNPSTVHVIHAVDRNGRRLHTSATPGFDILGMYEREAHRLPELAHNRIVADWYDVLTEIFATILRAHDSGAHRCAQMPEALRMMKRKTKTETPTLEDAIDAFPWLDWDRERLPILELVTDSEIEGWVFERVKKHVLVRNVLEHHDGILKKKQADRYGISSVTLTNESGDAITYKIGDRLRVGIWEVLDEAQIFDVATKQIAGTWLQPVEHPHAEGRDTARVDGRTE